MKTWVVLINFVYLLTYSLSAVNWCPPLFRGGFFEEEEHSVGEVLKTNLCVINFQP